MVLYIHVFASTSQTLQETQAVCGSNHSELSHEAMKLTTLQVGNFIGWA